MRGTANVSLGSKGEMDCSFRHDRSLPKIGRDALIPEHGHQTSRLSRNRYQGKMSRAKRATAK
jgi:hypothetical protein